MLFLSKIINMKRPVKATESKSKGKAKDGNSKPKAEEISSLEGFNPHHVFWATQYHNNIPNELVLLHFSKDLMKALKLDATTST